MARIVVVVPLTLSLRVAVAQSNVTVSGQVFEYQNESVDAFDGSVNVCATELSVDGLVLPSCAPNVPECFAAVFTAVTPLLVQPERLPVSNVPLTSAELPPDVTASATLVGCDNDPPVPVTVIV